MAKKEKKETVRCSDCSVGLLMQWDNNPVIVNCRNLDTKDVASTPRTCPYFKQGKNKIRKLTHF